ncbi:hypothetical protein HDU84_001990 [Entophlyctis sp. JEL0112]|nr:hypothetical protein HDU84_001990 [Entophlyctis sp. JEL0112]
MGTGFVASTRGSLKVQPTAFEALDHQVTRCMSRLEALKSSPLEQFTYLDRIRSEDSNLFYRVTMANLKKVVSIIYTPTVGLACQKFSHIYTPAATPGLFLSLSDAAHLDDILANYPGETPDISVLTDGSRILGLGDLGANGMGIAVGKLSLYVAAGGFNPARTLPIALDLGTNTPRHLTDPLYLGTRSRRPADDVFYGFVEAVMAALRRRWPGLLVQFEDFSSEHAFGTLERLKDRYFMFNDDIQGTGAVILSGFINAMRLSGTPLRDHRILFVGAGSAGVGVASQLMDHFVRAGGLSEKEAKSLFYLMDSKGLVTADRQDAKRYPQHKTLFMRDDMDNKQISTLLDAVETLRPTALIGLSSVGGTFTPDILKAMTKLNSRPIVFPLSNPLENAECTFEEAVAYSNGSVLFASGTAFPPQPHPVTRNILEPGQGNNMYIFPGLGFGAVLAKATHISDNMVYDSAVSLSKQLNQDEVSQGLLYPKIERIRETSAIVSRDVILSALKDGLVNEPFVLKLYGVAVGQKFDSKGSAILTSKNGELLRWVQSKMYFPKYERSIF